MKNLFLAIGSIIVCLLLGETAARIFLPPPARADHSAIVEAAEMRKPGNRQTFQSLHRPDPRIGWVLNEGTSQHRARLVDRQGVVQYDVVYNQSGGHRITAATPRSGLQLIAAGCSFTFGHGLNDSDTWPWLLQERLPEYHVVNAGGMGYGTDQALMAAERDVLRDPAVARAVVFGFGDFQIERNRGTQGWLVTVFPFSKPLFALNHGAAEYRRQVRFWDGGAAAQYSNLFGSLTNIFANRANGIGSHEEARKLTAALLIDYAARFQKLGVRFAVFVLPYHADSSPLARTDRSMIEEQLRGAGIPTLELSFPRMPKGEISVKDFMVSQIDRHPNRHYNLMLTEQLEPFLETSGIIPRSTR